MTERFTGVISPILTPFEDDLSVATGMLTDHALWSLGAGAHYISPFGTTGEAVSVGLAERRSALEALAAAGVPPERMMPGTGLCALPDTVELTRHAAEMGCAAVMVLPPFYYPTTEDGLFAHYAGLIEAIGSDALRVCLYHIPQMTGVPVSPALTAGLAGAFPGIVVG
jgi:4-hydroxy-tetrahydrodipicolinate synthase